MAIFVESELDRTVLTVDVLVIYSFIYLFLVATRAVSRVPEFIKKIKQKGV